MKFSSLFVILAVVASAPALAKVKVAKLSANSIPAGYIVISQADHALYIKLDDGRIVQFPVATPKEEEGMFWVGVNYVDHVQPYPDWIAPKSVARKHPELTGVTIKGGDPTNPMGRLAIVLQNDEIAIHGTNSKMAKSVGTSAPSGCVRMLNDDVERLAPLVKAGEPVCMGFTIRDAVRRCDDVLNQQPRRYLGDRAQLR